MTYKELIELYKSGQLDSEQRDKVEKDIERQEAISEYLFENEDIPALEQLDGELEKTQAGQTVEASVSRSGKREDEAENFAKMIRSYIRKAFVKMGVIVGAVILLITLFVIYVLPNAVDSVYYNPTELPAKNDEYNTNRISLDWATYSELFIPGYYRCNVIADKKGYGEYDITVRQISSKTGVFTNVSGKIEQGELVLYDDYILKHPTGNAFVPDLAGVEDYDMSEGAAGTYDEAMERLENLNDDDYYIAYITLDKVMTYSEFVEWSESNDADPWWCTICQKTEDGYEVDETVGFIYANSASQLFYDKDRYPYLTYFDATTGRGEETDWIIPEDVMTQHVVSMFKYMDDQDEFCKLVGYDNNDNHLAYYAKNVEDNGLNIYGFAVVAKKNDIIALSQLEGVAYVYTSLLR